MKTLTNKVQVLFLICLTMMTMWHYNKISQTTKPNLNLQISQFTKEARGEIYCLAENIYFEARGESNLGQMAVAWVTLNRVQDPNFPNTICEVVWEDGQFSWTHDGKSDKPTDPIAWMDAQTIAWLVYNTQDKQFDPTDGATMFHANYVKPKWRKEYEQTSRIDNHVFYKNFIKPS